jgi:hypothetical protein
MDLCAGIFITALLTIKKIGSKLNVCIRDRCFSSISNKIPGLWIGT